ncbi:MAG: putative zinc-binding metallopeptidase [Gemmatimonadales bacterium]
MSAYRRRHKYWWIDLSNRELLDTRLCDLELRITGTLLEKRIEQLYDELASRGFRFRPHCWLAEEWFAPHESPGIAIPFYLAHPRLAKLEARHMLEVEGGTVQSCMQLLRHEAGHAFETAYRLSSRLRWKRTFGDARRPYPTHYRPKPSSRSYVLHLDWWYAQCHPTEDFAETFAIWLRPGFNWRKRYEGWRALKKLEYVDELMDDIANRVPPFRSRRQIEPARKLRVTLREHYARKIARFASDHPDFYDNDLRRLFAERDGRRRPSASAFLRKHSRIVREVVTRWTGESAYTINIVLREMIVRARELDLRVDRPMRELRLELAVMVTMQTMNYVHSIDHRIPV